MAAWASSPKPALRPFGPSTVPARVVSVDTSTFQRVAGMVAEPERVKLLRPPKTTEPVPAPSSSYRNVRGGQLFQAAVPSNWQAVTSNSAVKFSFR